MNSAARHAESETVGHEQFGAPVLDITGRQQAGAVLPGSEERFQSLFEFSPIPIALHSADGRLVQTNRAYQRMLGYSDGELRALGVRRITHPEDVPEGQRLFEELRDRKRDFYERKKRFFRKDGKLVQAQASASAVRDAGGRLHYIISMVQDVTERTKGEKRQHAFSELGHRLSAAATPQEAGKIIVETADELFGWDACYIHLYSPDDQIVAVLTIDTVEGKRVEFPPSTFSPEPSPMMRQVTEEGPKLILRSGPGSWKPEVVPFGDKSRAAASLMYVPIHSGARVLGVFSIQSYRPGAYAAEDLNTLQALAEHCGAALERISVAERLSQREAGHRALLEAVPDWMFRLRADGTVVDSKAADGDPMSLACRTPVGSNLRQAWPPALAESTLGRVEETVRSGRAQRFEFQYIAADRRRFYEARLVRSGADEVLAIVRDFTEQTRLEQEILDISAHEQQRIGKDLHDDLGQLLTGVGYLVQALEQKLAEKSNPEAGEAGQIGRLIAQALAHTRMLARGLFPVELYAKGLVRALQELACNVEKIFAVSCSVQAAGRIKFRDSAAAEHIYRLVQEAVSNALKHGRARRILIGLQTLETGLEVTVKDDGIGVGGATKNEQGMGLRIMQYRARCVGAEFSIRPDRPKGTVVTCTMQNSVLRKGPKNNHGQEKSGKKR